MQKLRLSSDDREKILRQQMADLQGRYKERSMELTQQLEQVNTAMMVVMMMVLMMMVLMMVLFLLMMMAIIMAMMMIVMVMMIMIEQANNESARRGSEAEQLMHALQQQTKSSVELKRQFEQSLSELETERSQNQVMTDG
jgi:ABC-type transport system involved in cytochrome bd biosynthesis fused ATPase/permease subunit